MEIELDHKIIDAPDGSTILEVALQAGKYIPHFCYHKKLSIAANCRMCLVEVEKSSKPLPACATPITQGMKIHTNSAMAIAAQNGVMEFLLINHPLDCPICDQGGECQLQDLAVGYGRSETRFTEEKRVVNNKNLGSLIDTSMTRCIHCSRCIRFTDEIANTYELGMSYRNNHVEVMPFHGKTVNNELSGNIIDICPVGALNSKPFHSQYRTWELSRRKSISPHDGLGSNIVVQVDKYHKVVRVLPLENEMINECWLSDRDRFSYEGLYHKERVTTPMIKQDGKWHEVDWETALNYVATTLTQITQHHGASAVGALANPIATTEELYILQKLMRGIGVHNLDYRMNQTDFRADGLNKGVHNLGVDIAAIQQQKSILLIGSLIRQEQPLIAHRIRTAVKHGTELHVLNVQYENLLCPVKNQITCDPREIVYFLAQIVKASNTTNNKCVIDLSDVVVTPEAQSIAVSLMEYKGYIVLGEITQALGNYSEILFLAQQLKQNIQGNIGKLSASANEVGAELVGFLPYRGAFATPVTSGLNVNQMCNNAMKAYILLHTELEYDSNNSRTALDALKKAEAVIVMTAFTSDTMKEYADVILPIAPYTETAGSYINMQGIWQKFNGTTRPLGEAKPGWKVLRVLAEKLLSNSQIANIAQDEFMYNTIEDVRQELQQLNNVQQFLSNEIDIPPLKITTPHFDSLMRVGYHGIYARDSITRRALSLQQTPLGDTQSVFISKALATKLKIIDKQTVSVQQDDKSNQFEVRICDNLSDRVVVLAVNQSTVGFSGRFDQINISA